MSMATKPKPIPADALELIRRFVDDLAAIARCEGYRDVPLAWKHELKKALANLTPKRRGQPPELEKYPSILGALRVRNWRGAKSVAADYGVSVSTVKRVKGWFRKLLRGDEIPADIRAAILKGIGLGSAAKARQAQLSNLADRKARIVRRRVHTL